MKKIKRKPKKTSSLSQENFESWIRLDVKALWKHVEAVESKNRTWLERGLVEVVLVTDAKMKKLNATYAGKDKVTDVLSFESPQEIYEVSGFIGQVVIATGQMQRQALSIGHPMRSEFRALLVHGLLHLMGWDHERGPKEAKKMGHFEQSWLKRAFKLTDRGGKKANFCVSLVSRG